MKTVRPKVSTARSMSLWLFMFLLCLIIQVEFANAVACPLSLNCSHGVPCVEGNANFSNHPQLNGNPLQFHNVTNRDGVHCQCPDGWTGVECNHEFRSCDTNHTCYHGGSCIDGLVDAFGNSQLFCDCHEAQDQDGNRFVGKFCEHPVVDHCPQTEESFCVNGGICNGEYPRKGPPCKCGEGFEGPHCEFKSGSVPKCTLSCGEGHCQLGITSPEQANEAVSDSADSYMRCVCPPNFKGSDCKVPTAGILRNHPAEICTVGERGPGKPLSFCINNGTCMFKVTTGIDHPGCECPDAFVGPHCEIKIRSVTELPDSGDGVKSQPQSTNTIGYVVGVTAIVAAVTGATMTLLLRRFRGAQKKARNDPTMVNLAPAVTDPEDLAPDGVYRPSLHYPVVDVGPQRDEDGHDLHDIELL